MAASRAVVLFAGDSVWRIASPGGADELRFDFAQLLVRCGVRPLADAGQILLRRCRNDGPIAVGQRLIDTFPTHTRGRLCAGVSQLHADLRIA